MLLGRQPRTSLDLLIPDLSSKVKQKQQALKTHHDLKTKERTFQAGDTVSVCNFPGDTWIQGIIDKPSDPLSFYVKLQDGRVIRQHTDHILTRSTNSEEIPNPMMTGQVCLILHKSLLQQQQANKSFLKCLLFYDIPPDLVYHQSVWAKTVRFKIKGGGM